MIARSRPLSKGAPKSSRVIVHMTLEQKAVLQQAAKATQKTLTQFILDAGYQAAEQALLDRRLFVLSKEQYQAFLEILDRPVQPKPRLASLLSSEAPWADRS